ncbi:MAG TPA: carboxypeptidase-like regulatory domain-containing protein, partial [Candidatus Acidoferrum sp.]|nr:carboxypeptidase-like regulatory domain-containing protein [Candidatus Acidoferrum sp.]
MRLGHVSSDSGSWIQKFAAVALLVLSAVAPGTVYAQSDGSISGSISDSTGGAVAGATVSIRNAETGAQRTVSSDESGRFHAASLAVGSYGITVEKAGFESISRSAVALAVGQHEELSFVLRLGDVHQTVEVPANPGVVVVTTEDVAGLVGERQVKELPLNGRSYDQLLTLNPGVINYTSQRAGGVGTSNSVVGNMFAASGRRPQENLFLLNGVEFTGASEINNTPGGVSGALLGVDAVREFAVVKDSYGAAYGKRPGAQVSIVSASGGNQFHGSLYEFTRNGVLDARNFFDHGDIPEFQRNNFGASLGGPLHQDRSFFFVNYEGLRQNLGLSNLALVPDDVSRANAVASIKPLLALWPVANGRELLTSAGAPSGIAEAFTNPQQNIREDFGTARFDQTFSSKDSLSAVYTADDSQAHSPSGNPLTFADVFLREQVVSLSETHVFSAQLLNKATFGFSRGAFYFNSGTAVDLPGWVHAGQPVGAVVVGGGTTLNGASQITNGGTNAGSNLSAVRNLFTVTDQLTLNRGIHTFSIGAWFERIQANDALVQDQYGQISFSNLQSFLAGNVSTYTFAPSATPLSWRSSEGALYIEDTLRPGSSFELRIGFRGEFTNGWKEANGRAANYLFDSTGTILSQPHVGDSPFTENHARFLPAPRIGFAWSPFGTKKTVLRGGFGLYYALLDSLSYRLDQNGPFNTVLAVKNISFSAIAPDSGYTAAKVIPSGVQPDLRTPTVESWSLKVERELAAGTSLGVGYVGSH